jgi:hypothetical protein
MNCENSKTGGGGLQWRNENEKYWLAKCIYIAIKPGFTTIAFNHEDRRTSTHWRRFAETGVYMKSASPFQRANWLSVSVLALVMLFSCEQLAQAAHVTITTQPHDTNVLAGSNATFTVVASGTAPLSYRWRFNGTNLTNDGRISGATNATLTISNVVTGDAGGYRVVVSNSVSSVTSVVATLTVQLPPALSDIPNQRTFHGIATRAILFTVSNVPAPVLLAGSSNPSLVPTNNIVFGGSGSNWNVTVTPAGSSLGSSTITVTVTDQNGHMASKSFLLTVGDFSEVPAGLPNAYYGTVRWVDYDNDGYLDLFLSGYDTNYVPHTWLYHNNHDGTFTEVPTPFPNWAETSADWADFDNDGYLDLVMEGTPGNGLLLRAGVPKPRRHKLCLRHQPQRLLRRRLGGLVRSR